MATSALSQSSVTPNLSMQSSASPSPLSFTISRPHHHEIVFSNVFVRVLANGFDFNTGMCDPLGLRRVVIATVCPQALSSLWPTVPSLVRTSRAQSKFSRSGWTRIDGSSSVRPRATPFSVQPRQRRIRAGRPAACLAGVRFRTNDGKLLGGQSSLCFQIFSAKGKLPSAAQSCKSPLDAQWWSAWRARRRSK